MKWELIDEKTNMSRAPIRGGWLIREKCGILIEQDGNTVLSGEYRVALCFVPDPMHGWKL